ncbi:hypothetical protein [Tepidibacter hydrothermalis]|uniref:Uncharacterized protein n=1 Tax=Tepidibacter hydrothermalis TaxID=3036126 RepID=A0ABY8EJ39_9FIRM|nr:hypothetical protein [Tepidibacter hydrothermalis]WFD11969.1 hypothetical protein P4S50_07795 [Tepidibacter hydrothermalis]
MKKIFVFLLTSLLLFNLTGFTFCDKQEYIYTGYYNGMIDDNSIEVSSNNETLVLRLPAKLKSYFIQNILNENEYIEFKYSKNEYNQFILHYINFKNK